MIKKKFYCFFLFLLISCTNSNYVKSVEKKYNDFLDSQIGLSKVDLITKWGVPKSIKKQTNDMEIISYYTKYGKRFFSDTVFAKRGAIIEKGNVLTLENVSNFISSRNITVQGERYSLSIQDDTSFKYDDRIKKKDYLDCSVDFILKNDKVIKHSHFGTMCIMDEDNNYMSNLKLI